MMKNLNCTKFAAIMPQFEAQQWKKLDELVQLLYHWNQKVNLISRKDIDLLIPNHVIMSLSIGLVKKFEVTDSVMDVGTGGGLPGLPLAIMFPSTQFTLMDSCTKKIRIVEDMARSLNLNNVRTMSCRAEDCREKFGYIVGRGVSSLPTYLKTVQHMLKRPSIRTETMLEPSSIKDGILYIKGGDFIEELKRAGVSHYQMYSVTDLMTDKLSNVNFTNKTLSEQVNFPANDKWVLHVSTAEIIKRFRN